MTGPRVGLVVVNYASAHLLRANLASVDWPVRVRVVVVDNHSTPAETERVGELCAERGYDVISLPDNPGFAAGCNAGIARAAELGCAAVVLLNPDARATPEVVLALGDAAVASPDSLVNPTIVGPGGDTVFRGARLSLADGRIRSDPEAVVRRPQDWATGACVAMSLALHHRLGGLSEGYFLYWEDIELSHRCLAAGGALEVRADLRVQHDAGGTQRAGSGAGKSSLYYRWNTRNRLVFAARNLPRRDTARWLLTTPAVSWEILMRGGRRQLIRRPGLLVSAVRGSLEGAAIALRAVCGPGPAPSAGPGGETRGTPW